ncbi:MAG: type VI secretion protein IcmF/TssM N-terminal domain-containing protein [Pirellulales bacterium]
MANESPTEPKKNKPKKPFLRRLLPQSTAGWTACFTAFVLFTTVMVVWLVRRYQPDSVAPPHAISLGRMVAEVSLVLVIPIFVYWGVRRWNQVIDGEFPDIDKAWSAGISALQAQGISTNKLPIFLILGSSSRNLESELTHALNTRLKVAGIPDESGIAHALQWYVSDDAIYLFCPGASSLSKVLQTWRPASPRTNSLPRPQSRSYTPVSGKTAAESTPQTSSPKPSNKPPESGKPKASSLLMPKESSTTGQTPSPPASSLKPQPASASQPAPSYLGTIQMPGVETPSNASGSLPGPDPATRSTPAMPSLSSSPSMGPAAADPKVAFPISPAVTPGQAGQPTDFVGTVNFAQASGAQSTSPPIGSSPAIETSADLGDPSPPFNHAGSPTSNRVAVDQRQSRPPQESSRAPFKQRQIALPTDLDASDELPRLRYLCQLLQRTRRPRCGVNGIITLVPFDIAAVGPMQLSALSQSARGDLETIQHALGIRIPVTALLVGLEQDRGFIELARRLQPELLERRLGGRFDLRNRPTPKELNSHSDQICDAFESWVYRLFARDEALAEHRGNRKLYELISRIRYELKPRLRIFLGQAFGCEAPDETLPIEDDKSFFFSGCYFAATAATTGRPAFVKGVLQDKLMDEQSQVEWTAAALRKQRLISLFANLGWIIVVILAATLLVREAFKLD